MTEIISQCPKCSTSFRVSQEQLAMARGKVRCGFCMEIFKAEDFQITPGQEKALAEKSELAEKTEKTEKAEQAHKAEQAIKAEQAEKAEQAHEAEQAIKAEQAEKAEQALRAEEARQSQRLAEARQQAELERQADLEQQKAAEAEEQAAELQREEDEKLAQIERARLEKQRLEKERRQQALLAQQQQREEIARKEALAAERQEQQRLELEQLELEQLEQQRLEREQAEHEHLEQERLERERLEQERLEQERLEQERIEHEQQQQRIDREATPASDEHFTDLLETGLSDEELDSDLSFYELDADLEKLDQQLASAEQQLAHEPDDQWAEKLLEELGDESPTRRESPQAQAAPSDTPSVRASVAIAEPPVEPKPGLNAVPDPELESAPKPEPAESPIFTQPIFEPEANEPAMDHSILPDLLDLDAVPISAPVSPEAPKAIDWRWPVFAALLLFLVFAQYLFFYWNDLAQKPSTRPQLSNFCALAGCDLPVYRDLKSLSTDQLNIGSHPTAKEALLVDVIITNNGKIAQPFPILQLTFFNLRRKPVATRKFFPQEYLDGELRGLTDMPSQNPVRLALEVYDPGETAVNYELKLLPTL